MQGADHVYDFLNALLWFGLEIMQRKMCLISDPNDNFRMTLSSFTSDGATKALN